MIVSDRLDDRDGGLVNRILPGWEAVTRELKGLENVGQRVDIVTHRLSLHECPLCSAAFTHSLKSHTSNVLADGLRTQVHTYLDSHEMYNWLEHFGEKFWQLRESVLVGLLGPAGAESAMSKNETRVINVFVFDLATDDILLLDRFHQAVAYDDVVIAVQTRASAAVLDYSCGGRPVQIDPRDAKRQILAAVLQAGWGVAPTHEQWNSLTNSTETSFLWSGGPTPFGYFSGSVSLSFSQRDAAARNVLLTGIDATMSQLTHVLAHFARLEHELSDVLSHKDHLSFVRRWNFFSFKVSKATVLVSAANFKQALYYIRSARHDIDAIHDLVHRATESLQPSIVCERDQRDQLLSSSFKGALLIFVSGAAAYVLPTTTLWRKWTKWGTYF